MESKFLNFPCVSPYKYSGDMVDNIKKETEEIFLMGRLSVLQKQ